jgi:hypothetical protein
MFKYYKMSFSLLGTSCKAKTVACISNRKFFPLSSPVYEDKSVSMMQYPGHINKIPENKGDHKSSEVMKSCKNCS